MPKRLSKRLRCTIQELYAKGWSINKISDELKKSKKTIRRWTKRDDAKDKSRNIKVDERKKRIIISSLKKGGSTRSVGKEEGLSHTTVLKHARRNKFNKNGVFPYKPKKVLKITQQQQQKRINYIKKFDFNNQTRLRNQLKKRIYYDEKPWEIEKIPNQQNTRYWSTNKNIKQREFIKYKHPTIINMFAAISYYKKSSIKFYVKPRVISRGKNAGKFFFVV